MDASVIVGLVVLLLPLAISTLVGWYFVRRGHGGIAPLIAFGVIFIFTLLAIWGIRERSAQCVSEYPTNFRDESGLGVEFYCGEPAAMGGMIMLSFAIGEALVSVVIVLLLSQQYSKTFQTNSKDEHSLL